MPAPTQTSTNGADMNQNETPPGTSTEHRITVPDPLSVKQYLDHSCRLLTDSQLAQLGADPASASLDTSQAPVIPSACSWEAADSGARISVGFITNYNKGINEFKNNKKFGSRDIFKRIDIESYPAFITKKNEQRGECAINTGVNDKAILNTIVWSSTVSDPCAGLRNVVQSVITTLKGGS